MRFSVFVLLWLIGPVAFAGGFQDYYFSNGSSALASCGGSSVCTGANNSSGWWYYRGCGWEVTCRYWYSQGAYDACAGRAYTKPNGQCRDTPFTEAQCSGSGFYSDGAGNCTDDPPECSLGKVWTGSGCAWPETPPESCGIGHMPVVNASGATVACTPVLDDDEACDYSKGYDSSGYFLCSDRKNECNAQGGTHGYVDGVEVCIPGDYSPPSCASTETVVMTESGFVCSAPSDVKPPVPGDTNDSPGENPDDKCDPKTSDCDGDGNTDDSDGDGTNDNGTDPTTGTDETGKTGEAASSGSCNQPPVCSGGDPQVCALLRQSWEHMCRGSDLIEQADENQRKVFEDSFAGKVTSFGSDESFGVAVGEGVGVAGEGPLHNSQVGTWKGFVDSLVPSSGGCGSVTMELPSVAGGDWSISCDDTANIRAWLGWAMYLVTAFYLFTLVMRPMES